MKAPTLKLTAIIISFNNVVQRTHRRYLFYNHSLQSYHSSPDESSKRKLLPSLAIQLCTTYDFYSSNSCSLASALIDNPRVGFFYYSSIQTCLTTKIRPTEQRSFLKSCMGADWLRTWYIASLLIISWIQIRSSDILRLS